MGFEGAAEGVGVKGLGGAAGVASGAGTLLLEELGLRHISARVGL